MVRLKKHYSLLQPGLANHRVEQSSQPIWLKGNSKVWCHKKLNLWNYGIFGVWKNIQKDYLPKISIPGQISPVMLWWLHIQILLNSTQFITSGTESNWEGFVWSHQSETGPESPETICPTMRLFGQKTFQMLFFQNIQQIPLILILYFLRRHRFRTLWRENAGCE